MLVELGSWETCGVNGPKFHQQEAKVQQFWEWGLPKSWKIASMMKWPNESLPGSKTRGSGPAQLHSLFIGI